MRSLRSAVVGASSSGSDGVAQLTRCMISNEQFLERVGDFAVGGDGNLENPDSKRNRKVFHKSLSFLWIAHVENCR